MKRKEDRALLLGQDTYVDNLTVAGQLVMAVVRSPYARARISSIDTAAARAAEGVVAVFTGADLRDEWKSSLPCAWPVTEEMRSPEHFPLAVDEARYQGDGIAVVVAESRALAKDAAELVDVDYEPLPAAVEVAASLEGASPLVHEPFGTNECYVWKLATDDVDDVFAKADIVVSHTYYQPRLIPNAIEPRAILAQVGAGGDVTVHSATQVPHILRFGLALVIGIDEARVRVIAPDVGGGFGSKLDVYAEEALAVALARRLRRPVKWTEERSEGYQATIHGRDFLSTYELAATRDGRILGCRADVKAAMGAYLQLVTPGIPLLGAWLYAGPYDIGSYSVDIHGRLHEHHADRRLSRRGRPEATYVIERTMDKLALELGMDRVELRRRNFIWPSSRSDRVGSDDRLRGLSRVPRQAARDARPRCDPRRSGGPPRAQRPGANGVGFSTYNEMCGLAPSRILGAIRYAAGGWESATIRFQPLGSVQVVTGTSPHGQGPRDGLVPDRRGPARRRPGGSRGACTETLPSLSTGSIRTAAARWPSVGSRSGMQARR